MKIRGLIFAAAVLIAVTCMGADTDRKHIVLDKTIDRTTLPISDGVMVGNTLYIAGHIGLDPKTSLPPTEAETEAKAVMEATKQTVEAAGLTMDDVVTMQIFCTDLSLYGTFNDVYKTYFHGEYPARSFLGAAKLSREGRFEVLGVAVKKSQ
jgi:2-iminobutanoate/2-iminopropanoate deaminase